MMIREIVKARLKGGGAGEEKREDEKLGRDQRQNVGCGRWEVG